jgi:hypothetical protein
MNLSGEPPQTGAPSVALRASGWEQSDHQKQKPERRAAAWRGVCAFVVAELSRLLEGAWLTIPHDWTPWSCLTTWALPRLLGGGALGDALDPAWKCVRPDDL